MWSKKKKNKIKNPIKSGLSHIHESWTSVGNVIGLSKSQEIYRKWLNEMRKLHHKV